MVLREPVQFFAGVVVPPAPAAPLQDVFVPPAAPLHEVLPALELDSGVAEPVGVVEPPDVLLSPPQAASRPTRMPEAAVTARVIPIFMSFSSCVSLGASKDF